MMVLLAGEHVTTMGELDLTAARNRDFVELLQLFLENVEHPDVVRESHHHVEA